MVEELRIHTGLPHVRRTRRISIGLPFVRDRAFTVAFPFNLSSCLTKAGQARGPLVTLGGVLHG